MVVGKKLTLGQRAIQPLQSSHAQNNTPSKPLADGP